MKIGFEYIPTPYREVIKEYYKLILEYFGDDLISLVVFGSVARGTARKDSDVDMLIIVSRELPKSRLKRSLLLSKLEDKLDDLLNRLLDKGYAITFSPILKTVDEAKNFSPLYLDMIYDAIIIYDKNRFFQKILNKLSNKLDELGAERIWIGNKWYWRLKRDFKFGEEIIIE